MNHFVVNLLKTEYKIDFIDDMLLHKPSHIQFYFSINDQEMKFHIIHGDVSLLGMPQKNYFTNHEIKSLIRLDNELAEVEGKNSFLDDLIKKIKTMDDELYIYVPIHNQDKPFWLYVGLHKIKKANKPLIYGQVLKVMDHTPDEIIHYKKTYQDPLTKLFTRETLKKHLNYLHQFHGAYGIYFDIDNFKEVNDAYGHQQGDQLLKDLADSFIKKWEKNVIYYRLGGDEFFIYVYDHSKEDVILRAKALINDIENLNEMTKKVGVSASIGIVPITPDTYDYHKLLDLGDQYMYLSKHLGKGNITIYE
jgi:diguanylate cyclase (GGDEF)-like protein